MRKEIWRERERERERENEMYEDGRRRTEEREECPRKEKVFRVGVEHEMHFSVSAPSPASPNAAAE